MRMNISIYADNNYTHKTRKQNNANTTHNNTIYITQKPNTSTPNLYIYKRHQNTHKINKHKETIKHREETTINKIKQN